MENKNILKRTVDYTIKGEKITFTEKYIIDEKTKEEIYDFDIEMENGLRLADTYRKKHNLLTTKEIKNIRKKYRIDEEELAVLLRLEDKSMINCYENGHIQTASIDSLIRGIEKVEVFVDNLELTKDNFTNERYQNLIDMAAINFWEKTLESNLFKENMAGKYTELLEEFLKIYEENNIEKNAKNKAKNTQKSRKRIPFLFELNNNIGMVTLNESGEKITIVKFENSTIKDKHIYKVKLSEDLKNENVKIEKSGLPFLEGHISSFRSGKYRK